MPDTVQGEVLSTSDAAGDTVSVAEAAQTLNVHEKTLRRWIRTGRIPATKVDGPYGPQYQVPVRALGSAQQVLDVVKLERPTDPRALALAVAEAVHREHETLRSQLQADLAQLRTELLSTLTERLPTPPVPETMPVPEPQPARGKRWWWPFRPRT